MSLKKAIGLLVRFARQRELLARELRKEALFLEKVNLKENAQARWEDRMIQQCIANCFREAIRVLREETKDG